MTSNVPEGSLAIGPPEVVALEYSTPDKAQIKLRLECRRNSTRLRVWNPVAQAQLSGTLGPDQWPMRTMVEQSLCLGD